MNILYIGNTATYCLYKSGKNPSHWLYGAAEMEKDGHTVYWNEEKKNIFNDCKLILRDKPDIIFIPNLNIRSHFLLLLLKAFGLIKTPLYAFLHHTPKNHNSLKRLLYKILLRGINHCFFLSEKSMNEIIDNHYIQKNKCSLPGWGPDLNFYKKFYTSEDSGYYISTGKENRDFDILINAFSSSKSKLKIITCDKHGGRNHSYLKDKCKNISNIEVIITENNGDIFPVMVKEMAKAKAIVCPLIKEKLTYCVGLSTIADAEGLVKPLIITGNPYHESYRTKNFNVVNSIDDWIYAINNLKMPIETSLYNIDFCYKNMKKVIFN